MNYLVDRLIVLLMPLLNLPVVLLASIVPLYKAIVKNNPYSLQALWVNNFNKQKNIEKYYFHKNVIDFFDAYKMFYGKDDELNEVFSYMRNHLYKDRYLHGKYGTLFNQPDALHYILEVLKENRYIRSDSELLDPYSGFYEFLWAIRGDMKIDYRYILAIK